MLLDVVRIYVVYGVYRGEDSLKAQTRQNRDAGNQLRVTNNTFFPVNWKNFLRVEANKDGLFRLLANAIWEFQPPHGKQIISNSHHVSDKPASSYYTPWAPSAYTAFKALLSARLCAAIWSQISDCDETYNYWEPLHYLIHGHGFQTWEYSPQFAIRSYAYVWLYGIPLKLYVMLTQGHSMLEFYFLRTVMGFICALCEIFFYRSVCRCFGNNVGRLLLCIQLFSSGMFISSAAFLPSSFAMYMTLLAMGAWFTKHYPLAIFSIAASSIVGWPFAGALGIPIALDVIIRQKKLLMFVGLSLISAVICLTPTVAIDSYYYGKFVVAPLNIILYNVFSDHGPDLYGVEPWTFYFVNGFLNYNFVFLLALGVVPFVEERFLFPIYPMFSLGAALFLDHLQVRSTRKTHYTLSRSSQTIALGFCLVFATMSFSRSLALFKGYHAPLDIYGELTQLTSDSASGDHLSSSQINVCVGKEWYRFPSNFFLPNKRWKLQYLKSEFRGQLPKPYADGVNATNVIPSEMNDKNLEELTRYVDVSVCHYLIDLDLPDVTANEPQYAKDKQHWRIIRSADFLYSQRSHRFFRAFYIPFLSEQHCVYAKYNLLQSTAYKTDS
ncbi:hypothetical protein LSH36_305g00023 [Paralvinella palmiformis]|uniref:Mannosyltransferase n=1 Tax=Paralvinella palmiformis TaxID=53620 RepID=A0AAD9JH94_9ANNE|nr:hypothetical protein LSH36_305g00023 [Paralvinella palmiformis]